MQCEICGKYIDKGKRIRVEGSVVIACDKCSAYGEILGTATLERPRKKKPEIEIEKKEEKFEIQVDEELVDDFAEIIKDARERKNMKQEELGKLINEPASLIHRIEIGKIEPSIDVARKIQAKLGVRILKPVRQEDMKLEGSIEGQKELTLGDMVIVRKRKKA